MQVYLTNICDFDEIDINRLASFISIEDISKYRYFDDVKRHILSEIFKYIGYKMFTGIDEYLVVKRGKYGKPYQNQYMYLVQYQSQLHLYRLP